MNSPSPTAKRWEIILIDKNSTLNWFIDMHMNGIMNGCKADKYEK